MIATKKLSLFSICIFFLLSACNADFSKDANRSLKILEAELTANTMRLLDEIDMKIDDATKSRVVYSDDEKFSFLNPLLDGPSKYKIKKYHKLTKKHIKFLSEIQEAFFNTNINPLIQNDVVTKKGDEYLGRMKLYEKEIRKLWDKESINNKIGITLDTESIQNRDGSETPHIVYYFDNLPKKGIITYLRQKQYAILLLEKDFLHDLMLENSNKQLLQAIK